MADEDKPKTDEKTQAAEPKPETKGEDKQSTEAPRGDETAKTETAAAKDEPKKAAEQPAKDKDEPKAEVPAKFKKLVEEIEQLSVLELSELVKSLEDRFGVSAAAPMAMAPAAAGGGEAGGEEAEEGKKEFNIILKEAGAAKIEVIKAVREISGLGLAESKAIVDGAPKTVKEKAPKDEAEEAKQKLEAAGATVELE